MILNRTGSFILGLLAVPAAHLHAQGAPGDDCRAPIQIPSCGGMITFDTTGATASGFHPGCGGVTNRVDLWYSLTPTVTGVLVLDTCGSSFDTRLAIWDSCGGSVLGCNDDAGAMAPCPSTLQSHLEVPVSAGTPYLIQVGGFNAATGLGVLNVGGLAPANDDCANAWTIAGYGDFAFDNSCASTDGPADPLCDTFGTDQVSNDVWFTWSAPQTATVTIQTCGGTALDTKVAVMDASGSTTIACNDDTCGLQSSVSFAAVQGTDYKIRIGSFSPTAFGSGTFNVGVSIIFQGLKVQPLGSATLTPEGTQLLIGNIGSSGVDGVRILLPTGSDSWSVAFEPFDLVAAVPTTFVSTETLGTTPLGPGNPVGVQIVGAFIPMLPAMREYAYTVDMTDLGATGLNVVRKDHCGDLAFLTLGSGIVVGNFMSPRGTGECGYVRNPDGTSTPYWKGLESMVPMLPPPEGMDLYGNADRVEFEGTGPVTLITELDEMIVTAADIPGNTIRMKMLRATPPETYPAPGLSITEVVDGTLRGGQPKYVEITNQGSATIPLGDFSLGTFTDGAMSLLLAGGTSLPLSPVTLAPGDSWVVAYESATNTDCDPAMLVTCFEHVYGFLPDQFLGAAPAFDGNDAIALFRGIATGDAEGSILIDLYGDIGENGTGENWEYTDSYARRNTIYWSPWFNADEWEIGDSQALGMPGDPDAIKIALHNNLTSPGVDDPCESPSGCIGTNYCSTAPNSVGPGARICATGSASVSANDLILTAGGLPPAVFGLFYFGTNQDFVPFGDGFRCVAGQVFRLVVVQADGTGLLSFPLDYTSGNGTNISAGSLFHFQAWYRDPMGPGGSTFNLSDAVSIAFQP